MSGPSPSAEWSGEGPPLVLCHGGPGLWDMGVRPERLARWQELTDRPVRSEAEAVDSLERALPRVRG